MRNKREHIQPAVVMILAVAGLITCTAPFLASSGLVSAQAAAPNWSYTGSLNTARLFHTTTLLANGKVLVAGGCNDAGCLAFDSAELYDPVTGTWGLTGGLNVNRVEHSATLLPNGKVLVAGGWNRGVVGSAELTRTWSLTASLNVARFGLTATLLPNGNVLVTGGESQSGVINNSAELYNPITETWSYTGSFSTGRYGQTATLLPNGKVLVAGGHDWHSNTYLDSADVYDSATGNWSGTAKLNTARLRHTAVLLQSGKVLVVGGSGRANRLLSAELYDSGSSSTITPIDDPQFFVYQHYRDFLNREADREGLAFWTNEITSCGGDQGCIEVKRINDSASFFHSIEFQETGYLAYRTYLAAFGNLPNAPVPITFSEFIPDTQAIGRDLIVRQAGWEQVLENNKRIFTAQFVERARFTAAFTPAMSAQEFVDKLNGNAGNPLSQTERDLLVSDLSGGRRSRVDVLRAIAENPKLVQAEFNRAFVLMQYFGYLRRNPNDAPDGNFVGYNFWLDKLNQFNGNFIDAEMVKAFLSSIEYRQRFGP